MKKQILSVAVLALLAVGLQSCGDKKETKPEEELTIGNKVDTLATDIEEAKDTAVTKVKDAAEDVKDGTVKTAKEVDAALKK